PGLDFAFTVALYFSRGSSPPEVTQMTSAAATRIRKLSRRGFGSTWARRIVGLVMTIGMAAAVASACSPGADRPEHPLPGTGGAGGGAATTGSGPACSDGDERSCHITIGEHD